MLIVSGRWWRQDKSNIGDVYLCQCQLYRPSRPISHSTSHAYHRSKLASYSLPTGTSTMGALWWFVSHSTQQQQQKNKISRKSLSYRLLFTLQPKASPPLPKLAMCLSVVKIYLLFTGAAGAATDATSTASAGNVPTSQCPKCPSRPVPDMGH